MIDPFGSGRKSNPQAVLRVKTCFREVFEIGEETSLMVTELRCTEPGCPPIETVIAVLEESGTRQYKVHKSAPDVSEEDIRKLVEEEEV